MAKFIKIREHQYINLEQITSIEFDSAARTQYYTNPCISFSIMMSNGQCHYFSDRKDNLEDIRRIIDDIRYHNEMTEQPPSFWDLTCDIEEWLNERMKEYVD